MPWLLRYVDVVSRRAEDEVGCSLARVWSAESRRRVRKFGRGRLNGERKVTKRGIFSEQL